MSLWVPAGWPMSSWDPPISDTPTQGCRFTTPTLGFYICSENLDLCASRFTDQSSHGSHFLDFFKTSIPRGGVPSGRSCSKRLKNLEPFISSGCACSWVGLGGGAAWGPSRRALLWRQDLSPLPLSSCLERLQKLSRFRKLGVLQDFWGLVLLGVTPGHTLQFLFSLLCLQKPDISRNIQIPL